jgi:hypothetical protein
MSRKTQNPDLIFQYCFRSTSTGTRHLRIVYVTARHVILSVRMPCPIGKKKTKRKYKRRAPRQIPPITDLFPNLTENCASTLVLTGNRRLKFTSDVAFWLLRHTPLGPVTCALLISTGIGTRMLFRLWWANLKFNWTFIHLVYFWY